MDRTEDLSARILLDNILSTDEPRTPITRSASVALSSPRRSPRHSPRHSTKHVGGQTPQGILRRSMKDKMRESITRKYQPATQRRTASVSLRRIDTPGQASMLLDTGDTPRNLLMNILHTDLARSPVSHEEAATEEPQPSSDNSSLIGKHQSSELSGLDLPDVTLGNAASIAQGMRRKRPRRSINVTAFEKRLKAGDGDDAEETSEQSVQDHSSLSLSSTSLSLKTPFVEARTERRGLQRRVANCQRLTVEGFSAAVNQMQIKSGTSFEEKGNNETTFSENFTLALNESSEPDITTDVVRSDTALYAEAEAMTSESLVAPTQEKSTVMASQIQRQMMMEGEESKQDKHRSLHLFPPEEEVETETEGTVRTKDPPEGVKGVTGLEMGESQEVDDQAGVQTREEAAENSPDEGGTDSQPEEDVETKSQSEEEEIGPDSQEEDNDKGALSSEPEDPGSADLHSEEEEIVPDSQEEDSDKGALSLEPEDPGSADLHSEEEEIVPDSQEEDNDKGALSSETEDPGSADLQSEEEEIVPDSQKEKEDEEEEEIMPDSQEEEEEGTDAANSQSLEEGDPEEHLEDPADAGLADSQSAGEEEDGELALEEPEQDLEHISRRAYRSEGGVLPITDAGWSESRAHSAVDGGSPESSQPHIETLDMEEPSAQGEAEAPHPDFELDDDDKENSIQPSAEDDEHQSDRESEDNDSEDSDAVPSKTPAFVKERREKLRPDNMASPSVFMNVRTSFAGDRTNEGEPAPKRKVTRRATASQVQEGIPNSYLIKVFKHFARAKVSADVKPILKQIVDKYIVRLAEDLETYATHAKRKSIDVEDVVLLLRRQGYVNDKVPVEVLIEKYLRMDQRKILIPIPGDGKAKKKKK